MFAEINWVAVGTILGVAGAVLAAIIKAILGPIIVEWWRNRPPKPPGTPPIGPYDSVMRSYIEDKARDFVGRRFVFDKLDSFVREHDSGYFIIVGDPGIGKSALMAKLIKDRGYIHHFNIAENINSTQQFLANISVQISKKYGLEYEKPPQEENECSHYLHKYLSDAVEKTIEENKKINGYYPVILAIDALDEVDDNELNLGVNVLHLPQSLPKGIYIIATIRPVFKMHLYLTQSEFFLLKHDSGENLEDIRFYIKRYSQRKKMKDVLSSWDISRKAFIELLTRKSDGNFMYLHHMLPAIERGEFSDQKLEEIPQGLDGYYQFNWDRMEKRKKNNEARNLELVIGILGAAQEAITEDQIEKWTDLNKSEIKQGIQFWYEFLHKEGPRNSRRYRIYHSSFQEFIFERVDDAEYHQMISDFYLEKVSLDAEEI